MGRARFLDKIIDRRSQGRWRSVPAPRVRAGFGREGRSPTWRRFVCAWGRAVLTATGLSWGCGSRTEGRSLEALAVPDGVAARRVLLDPTHDLVAPVLVVARRLDPVGEKHHLMAASPCSFGLCCCEKAGPETAPPQVRMDPQALELAGATPCAPVTGADELALSACLDAEVAVLAEPGPGPGLLADGRLDEGDVVFLGPHHHSDAGLHRPAIRRRSSAPGAQACRNRCGTPGSGRLRTPRWSPPRVGDAVRWVRP